MFSLLKYAGSRLFAGGVMLALSIQLQAAESAAPVPAAAAPAPATPEVAKPRPLNFTNDIAPILTKAGCNTGACHAKSGGGQRGFELSLLGFEPQEDYEHIVKEARGRRVFPSAPEQSLLVLKPANIVPHGGGKHLDPDSAEYKTLVRWISEGMRYGSEDDPVLESSDVQPKRM